MESRPACDVQPEQYATVIRELIRHENDVTNHRIMWLLIVQGLLVNAYVFVKGESGAADSIALAGILVTISSFVMLYKSYQARGYLNFLGEKAKQGTLREECLPLDGWPRKRIRGWRRGRWLCPWIERSSHVLEPYLFLPVFTLTLWICSLFSRWLSLSRGTIFGVSFLMAGFMLSLLLIFYVWSQLRCGEEVIDDRGGSR